MHFEGDGSIDGRLIVIGHFRSDEICSCFIIYLRCLDAFPAFAVERLSVAEIPMDLCRQTVHFKREIHSVADARHLSRMGIYSDG